MDPLPVLNLTLLIISFLGIRFRVPPIFNLIGGILFLGILIGMPVNQIIGLITSGLGRVFALFALIILSGAIIAATLEEQGYITLVVKDIRRYSGNSTTISGVAGYLFRFACGVTAFVILPHPVVKGLEKQIPVESVPFLCSGWKPDLFRTDISRPCGHPPYPVPRPGSRPGMV